METSKQRPGQGAYPETQTDQIIPAPRGPGKLDRMLAYFAAGNSLNVFEAQRMGDTCLATTVACLQSKHGIHFTRSMEKVPTRFDSDARVMRYWLCDSDLERATEIVAKKGAEL